MKLFTRFTSRAGFVTETADEPLRHLAARFFETITVKELPVAMCMAEEKPSLGPETHQYEPEIETLRLHLNAAAVKPLRGLTRRELALSRVPPSSIIRPTVR